MAFCIQPSFSQLHSPVCSWSLCASPSCGARTGSSPCPSPGGAEEEGNPQDNWSGHGHPKTSDHPYSTLYVPGKHLLSSLAEMLASILPPCSCLVMPIRVPTSPVLWGWRRKKVREETLGMRELENGGVKKGRGKGSSLRATRQSQSLWQRQTRRRDPDRHWYAQAGTIG